MKTITLSELYRNLQRAEAVLIDGTLARLSLAPLENEPENQFAHIGWVDDEGFRFSAVFAEGENEMVEIRGDTVKLVDVEGDTVEFSLLGKIILER